MSNIAVKRANSVQKCNVLARYLFFERREASVYFNDIPTGHVSAKELTLRVKAVKSTYCKALS